MFPPKLLSRVCLCVLGVALATGSTPSLASTPKVSCIARWPLVSSLCWYDPEHCVLDARVSDSGNLFILNTNLAELSVLCPDNRCLLQYKPALGVGYGYDFVPWDDGIIFFYSPNTKYNLIKYDLNADSATPLTKDHFRSCGSQFMDVRQRNIGRLGSSDFLLVCGYPYPLSRKPEYGGLWERLWPTYVVNVSDSSITLVDRPPKVLGEDPRPPWLLMLAGEDGLIYRQEYEYGDRHNYTTISRRTPQASAWQEITIPDPDWKHILADGFRTYLGFLDLVAVDRKSALYFDYSTANYDVGKYDARFAKYAPDGTLQWAITNDDMQIKITEWMTLLRVMDDGKLIFWSVADYTPRKYEAYECTVNDGE